MKEVSGIPNGWASVKRTTSDQFPLPARRPRSPVMNKDKVKRVFGIEMAAWRRQLQDCLGDPGTHDAFQSLVRGR